MGKHKKIKHEQNHFFPKISNASRKLAARRLESLDTGGVPHFMLHTKTSGREPLAPIPTNQSLSINDSKGETVTANDSVIKRPVVQQSTNQRDKIFKDKTDSISNPDSNTMSGKADVNLDDNVFTFKPKVSIASAKIVENLGTDFMARQQQHLERQRRNVSFSFLDIYMYYLKMSCDVLLITR